MSPSDAATRERNLRIQELRETLERARLGGFFYPIASGLAFLVTSTEFAGVAVLVTLGFVLLAVARLQVRMPEVLDDASIAKASRRIWAIVIATTVAWGAFSGWSVTALPEPAPMVAILFSGAFGMALAHSLCMRRGLSVVSILSVMIPSQLLLASVISPGVAATWAVYMIYMLLVMLRSHREYHARLELEEDLRQQRDLFERRSHRDDLTGLANRRMFTKVLQQSLAEAPGSTSLLILDIDHFKSINDGHGHVAGDACLVAFAGLLSAEFDAPADVPVRLGGEEFGVVMQATEEDACRRAEAFRQKLERTPLAFEGVCIPVAVSIGCGAFDPRRHADVDGFYRDVDAALYRAKMAGRNRIEMAQEQPRVFPVLA